MYIYMSSSWYHSLESVCSFFSSSSSFSSVDYLFYVFLLLFFLFVLVFLFSVVVAFSSRIQLLFNFIEIALLCIFFSNCEILIIIDIAWLQWGAVTTKSIQNCIAHGLHKYMTHAFLPSFTIFYMYKHFFLVFLCCSLFSCSKYLAILRSNHKHSIREWNSLLPICAYFSFIFKFQRIHDGVKKCTAFKHYFELGK